MLNRWGLLFLVLASTPILEAREAKSHPKKQRHTHFQEKKKERRSLFDQVLKEVNPVEKKGLCELKQEELPPLEITFVSPHFESERETASIQNQEPFIPPTLEPLSLAATLPLAPLQIKEESFEEVESLANSDHFDIQVEYAPKRSRPGYVFKVTLLPRADAELKKIRQNYYFLIDRSNSIPRTRYLLNKKGVAEALTLLKTSDRFNILLFDDHVVSFREKAIACTPELIEEAKVFLEKQGHGGYFAATELYTSLGKIIPQEVAENEINTAILLSDGDTYLSQEKQRLTIGRWTAQNKGKVSLFTVATGDGNNLPLLELLSTFNKGSLIYAQNHQDVNERLSYLIRTLRNPLGKQMVATAVCDDKSMTVLLQPKQARIPDLYQNRPFVIYGTTNRLSDFVLFLQGRYYDHHFDIKKRISFDQAKLGSYSVERGWTQLVVQEFYERYFEDGNTSHLEAAKQLLLPLNLPTPMIDP